MLTQRVFGTKGTIPVQNFMKYGEDFVVKDNLDDLIEGMNKLARSPDAGRSSTPRRCGKWSNSVISSSRTPTRRMRKQC